MRASARTAVMLALVAFFTTAAQGARLSQTRSLDERIDSVALRGRVHARVILPADYAANGKRYPVVYFLHGLPATAVSYRGNTWVADALLDAGQAILVIPQGARGDDDDPEYLNWGSGRNWETYVAEELPRYVDAHFRTIHSRAGRAILGVSAGGYGATVLGLHDLARFSVIESWSGYFHPTDRTGTQALPRGPAASAHTLVLRVRAVQRSRPTFIAFYVGRDDQRFRAENVQFDQELTAAGVHHVFELYRGAHETSLWQAHAVAWLRLALTHLAAATSTHA